MSPNAFGQENIKEELPTGKVNKKSEDYKKSQPKKVKSISYITVKDGENKLIGNACALSVTHDMGFEYVLLDKKEKSFRPNWKRFWQNTGVKTKLVFTKGPWWKSTINKKFKQCAIQSGDFRG